MKNKMKKFIVGVMILVFVFGFAASVCSVKAEKIIITEKKGSVEESKGYLSTEDDNLVKIGEEFTVKESEEIEDLIAIGCKVKVLGKVKGDLVGVCSDIYMGPKSSVDGDAVIVLGKLDKAEGAIISGSVVRTLTRVSPNLFKPFKFAISPFWTTFSAIPRALVYILLILITIALAPKKIEEMSEKLELELGKSLLFGLLGFICILPLTLLLLISIIGIPFIIVELIFIIIVMIMGYTAVCLILGRRIVLEAKLGIGTSLIVQVLIGALIITLVRFIPFLGFLAALTIYSFGFGAALMVLLSRKKVLDSTTLKENQ